MVNLRWMLWGIELGAASNRCVEGLEDVYYFLGCGGMVVSCVVGLFAKYALRWGKGYYK